MVENVSKTTTIYLLVPYDGMNNSSDIHISVDERLMNLVA